MCPVPLLLPPHTCSSVRPLSSWDSRAGTACTASSVDDGANRQMSAADVNDVAALARDIDMSSLGVALLLRVLRTERVRLPAVSADSGVRGGRPVPACWVLPLRAAALPCGEPSLPTRDAMALVKLEARRVMSMKGGPARWQEVGWPGW